MVTISNSELTKAMRLIARLVSYASSDETRDKETRRQAGLLLKKLAKRKEIHDHGKLEKLAQAGDRHRN